MSTSSNEEGYSNNQYLHLQAYNYGWNTTSHEYHAHVSSLERSPSVFTDFPKYPNVHKIFNKKVDLSGYEDKTPPRINQQHHAPQGAHNKKVHFADQEKAATQVVKADDNNKNGKNVYGESIDAKADGFIKQKLKNFELAKWETFKEP